MKRLGIYLTYDRQGKIDRYIGYFLKEMRPCVSSLAVVCNMEEISQGEEHIREYADQIFFRKNMGFDAGGFKDALCSLIGWDAVLEYDEIVLANDSMFGPFRPMREIFGEMDTKEADFWGLTKNGPYQENGTLMYREHIQTFFLVIRSKMLHDPRFMDYWEAMPYFESFHKTIQEYELKFTAYFSSLGYTYDVLADMDANNSPNLENNYCQYSEISCELIKKRNFPFFKKKQLADEFELLERNTQENMWQSIKYVEEETDYDVDLIWENVIRTLNVGDLQRTLHVQYIIAPSSKNITGRIAVIVFIAYASSFEYVLEYLQKLPPACDVEIVSDNSDFLIPYRHSGYRCNVSLPEEMGAFLSGFSSYDYVCVVHDTDMGFQERKSCTEKSYFFNVWSNLLQSADHISGIVECFENNRWLGFLAPPQPNFSVFFGELGKGWNGRYQEVERAAANLNLNCQLSEFKAPFRVTNDFWIRGGILRQLGAAAKSDASCLPYLWSYLAQSSLYYSGIVETPEYAAINEVNLQYYLEQISSQIRRWNGGFHTFLEMQKKMQRSELERFCRNYSHIYVYGTGHMARCYQDMLPEIDGYVVSDGQVKISGLNGKPVKYLSEIELSEDCGIVLCLYKANQSQVVSLLKARGFENYFCAQ